MLDIDIEGFRRTFNEHRKLAMEAGGSQGSRDLLLVYAIECGLKFLVLRNSGKRRWLELPESRRFGHDLVKGLRDVGLVPPKRLGMLFVEAPHQAIAPQRLHEAYRYGRKVLDANSCRKDLQDIVKLVEREVLRARV